MVTGFMGHPSLGHPCSTVQVVGTVSVFDETRPTIMQGVDWTHELAALFPTYRKQANNYYPTRRLNVGIKHPPSDRLYRQGICCHHYEIFNRQDDKKEIKLD